MEMREQKGKQWRNLAFFGDPKQEKEFQELVFSAAQKKEDITWEQLSKIMVDGANKLACKPSDKEDPESPNLETETMTQQTDQTSKTRFRDIFIQSRNPEHFKNVVERHGDEIEAEIRRECEEIESELRQNRSNPWRTLRRICGIYRESLKIEARSKRESLRIIQQFFAGIGGDDRGDPNINFDQVPVPRNTIFDGPFTGEELAESAERLARHKAPGIDNIPAEALRSITRHPEIRSSLLQIMDKIHQTGESPECWKLVIQVPIPKKGDLSQISNWRPICLVNSVVKLMNCMILRRIRPSIEGLLRDSQFGFRPDRSTAGAQLLLNDLTTRATRDKRGILVAFIDFAKAFPSVSYHAIRSALDAFRVGPAMTRTIMSLYTDLQGIVRTPYGNTQTFPITTGILQGDVLAPYLFVLVIDRILHRALDKKPQGILLKSTGTKSRGIQEVRLTDIDYADDIALLSSTTAQEARPANLSLALGRTKTAWMAFGKVPGGSRELRSESLGKIPLVDSYRHLGHMQDATASAPIKDRLRLTWAAFRRMREIWISPLAAATKLRLFDCLVYPILTFGAGALFISNAVLKRVEVEINMMRRFACNCAKLDDFGHCFSLESLYCGTPRFSTVHRVSRAKLIGHMLRHLPVYRELVQWKSKETARQSSPSEACFKDLGITLEEALVYSSDQTHWQKLCEELRQNLEPLPDYIRLQSSQWKAKHRNAIRGECYGLQFVEEGPDPFPIGEEEVHMYIDGSVRTVRGTNEGRGGAGIVIKQTNQNDQHYSIRLNADTPERAGMESLQQALNIIPEGAKKLILHTDSFYVWNFFHLMRFRRRVIGYNKVPNGDLLPLLDRKIRSMQAENVEVFMCKVRSHNGNTYNEKADALAVSGTRKTLHTSEPKRRKKTPGVVTARTLSSQKVQTSILSGETKTLSVAKRCAVEDGTPPLKVGVSSVELPSEKNEYLGSSNTHKVKKKQHKGTKKELQQVMEESGGGGVRMKLLRIRSCYKVRKGCFLNWF